MPSVHICEDELQRCPLAHVYLLIEGKNKNGLSYATLDCSILDRVIDVNGVIVT